MITYPATYRARQALRSEHLKRAEREGAKVGRSMKCNGEVTPSPLHAGMPEGCANDGTTCLCACHDQS